MKYIATQMGHHSAAFTLDTYGHLMDRLPVHPVEWIDDLFFPEGLDVALNLHLSGALSDEISGHAVQSSEERKPNSDAAPSDLVQSGGEDGVVGRAGLEPATLGLRVRHGNSDYCPLGTVFIKDLWQALRRCRGFGVRQ